MQEVFRTVKKEPSLGGPVQIKLQKQLQTTLRGALKIGGGPELRGQ